MRIPLVAILFVILIGAWNVPIEKPQKSSPAEAQNSQQGTKTTISVYQEVPDNKYPRSAKELLWRYASPEGALVIVAFFTLATIICQSIHTKQAAEATRASVEVQKASYRQWLIVKDWKIENRDQFLECDDDLLKLSFSIVNPTGHPLDVLKWKTIVSGRVFEEVYGETLTPNGVIPVILVIETDREANSAFAKNELMLLITIKILFRDVLNVEQWNNFLTLGRVGRSVEDFNLPVRPTEETTSHKKQKDRENYYSEH